MSKLSKAAAIIFVTSTLALTSTQSLATNGTVKPPPTKPQSIPFGVYLQNWFTNFSF